MARGVFELWGRQELLPYAVALLKTHIQQTIKNIWSRDYRGKCDTSRPYSRASSSSSDDVNLFNEVEMELEYPPSLTDYFSDWGDSELLQVIIKEDYDEIYRDGYDNLTREEMIDIISDLLEYQRDPLACHCILDHYKYPQESSDSDSDSDSYSSDADSIS